MRAAIAILMAFALALSPTGAIAEEHADEQPYELTVSDERAEIVMPGEVAERSTETSVVFDTDEGLLSGGFAFAEAEEGEQLDVRLHQIVEYADKNDNGHFDDEDEVASAWNLANASKNTTSKPNATVAWRALETTNVTSEDGVEGTTVHAVAEFPEQDPIAGVMQQLGQGENRTLTVNLTVFDEATTYEGTEVPASHVHVAWAVDNFPYTREETKLALVAETNATGELALGIGEEEPELAASSQLEDVDVTLAADLAEQATVDGNETDANVTMLEADDAVDDEDHVAVNYERGAMIEHELVLGSTAEAASSSVIESGSDTISEVPAPGALIAVGLLATVAAALQRR